MGILSEELEETLNDTFRNAHVRRNEFVTVEHLLLGLLDNPNALGVLLGCRADIESLRNELTGFIHEHIAILPEEAGETTASVGLQRVIQRAVLHVQASGKREVTGAHVLVAICSEKESHAVHFLNRMGITRLDIVSFMAHGALSHDTSASEAGVETPALESNKPDESKSPLHRYCFCCC